VLDVLLARIRLNVWIGTQIITFWVLHRVSAEHSKTGRVAVNPFVPAHTPAIVVDVDLGVVDVHHLRL
jgi:hypothetical protein